MTRNKMSNDGKYFTTGGIIVTGCSRGIGEAIALELCKLNQNIIISGRNRKDLMSVAIKCNDKNPKSKCLPVAGDVTDSKHLKRLVDVCLQKFGSINSIVCNAGTAEPLGPMSDITKEGFQHIFNVNVVQSFELYKFARLELLRNKGRIINISSGASVTALPGGTPYSTTKAALNMLSAGIRSEGVDCIALRPGSVDTPMLRKNLDPDTNARLQKGKAVGTDENGFALAVKNAYADGTVLNASQPGRAIAVLAATIKWPDDIYEDTAVNIKSATIKSGEKNSKTKPIVKNWNDPEIGDMVSKI